MAIQRKCPSCLNPRPDGMYLCHICWSSLPAATRKALSVRGDMGTALARVRQLYAQIDAHVPLAEIRIAV